MKDYGTIVIELRKKREWSQERLARELGVSFQTIHRWESGKFNPSPLAKEQIDRLLKSHGLTPVKSVFLLRRKSRRLVRRSQRRKPAASPLGEHFGEGGS